jgi:hypothetical protein
MINQMVKIPFSFFSKEENSNSPVDHKDGFTR